MIRKACAAMLCSVLILSGCGTSTNSTGTVVSPSAATKQTAIQHVVVIFGENISFDHYFATYPNAKNPAGEPTFTAASGTPTAKTLASDNLITSNPNTTNAANITAGAAFGPFRLDRSQTATADQGHNYTPEQNAFDSGAMDAFPAFVGTKDAAALVTAQHSANSDNSVTGTKALTMGYYDGNTVTAMWNYAQRYAMNDHSFGSQFGPSTPGAINLISGTTNGAVNFDNTSNSALAPDGNGGLTLINDSEAAFDTCSGSGKVQFTGRNVGDLLTTANVSWGFFEGGFNLNKVNPDGSTGCLRQTYSTITTQYKADYIDHHQPFQYYQSTSNPNHTPSTSPAMVGKNADAANHQYDMDDWYAALSAGNLPSVSFLKAPGYQDAHAGYSDPLDEQAFVTQVINTLENSTFWNNTAVIIAYDDSDGWYDHVSNIVNGSAVVGNGTSTGDTHSACISAASTALPGVDPNTTHAMGRCGYGPRLPLLVISPWAKKNFIDSTVTDQSSVLRFVEDVFLNGTRIGQGSYDSIAGPLDNMFDFSKGAPQNTTKVLVDGDTGLVVSGN